jgi:hypothetical protein
MARQIEVKQEMGIVNGSSMLFWNAVTSGELVEE